MIVFTSISPNEFKDTGLSFIIYNLSSLFEKYEPVNILIDNNLMIDYDSKDFDMIYYNYIFENDYVFKEFMTKIIMNLYNGNNVLILVSNNYIFQSITESLIKILQQRYNILSNIVNDISDIPFIKDYTQFGDIGSISNLDTDRARLCSM